MDEHWEEEADINGVPVRIMTVDVQKDHFYAVIRAWSSVGAFRMIHCEKLFSWEALRALQQAQGVNDSLVFLDAGYATAKCAEFGWYALMGDRRSTFSHRGKNGKMVQRYYSPKRKVSVGRDRSAIMFYWSNLNIKDALARLRKNSEGAVWEVPKDAPPDYLDMLDSEHRTFERGHWIWKQVRNRANHYFDCEAMQVAVATMLKLVGQESVTAPEPQHAP